MLLFFILKLLRNLDDWWTWSGIPLPAACQWLMYLLQFICSSLAILVCTDLSHSVIDFFVSNSDTISVLPWEYTVVLNTIAVRAPRPCTYVCDCPAFFSLYNLSHLYGDVIFAYCSSAGGGMLKYKQEGCSEGEGSESKKQRKFHNMNRYSHCFQLFLCSHEFSSFTSSQCSGKKCFVPCFFDQCTGVGWILLKYNLVIQMILVKVSGVNSANELL